MQATQNVAQKLTINGVRLSLIVFSSSVALIFFIAWEYPSIPISRTRNMINDFSTIKLQVLSFKFDTCLPVSGRLRNSRHVQNSFKPHSSDNSLYRVSSSFRCR